MSRIDNQIILWAVTGQHHELLMENHHENVSQLRSWVPRRFKNYEDIKTCLLNAQTKTREMMSLITEGRRPPQAEMQCMLQCAQSQHELAKLDGEQKGQDVKAKHVIESIKACDITWQEAGTMTGAMHTNVVGALIAVGEPEVDLDTLRRLEDKADEEAIWEENRRTCKWMEEAKKNGGVFEAYKTQQVEMGYNL